MQRNTGSTTGATSERTIEIAVVDDHPFMVEGLKTVLSLLPGYRVVHGALNGEEFMEGLGAHPNVSIAIVDLQMRGTDGWTVLEHLRERRPTILRIALSFNNDPDWIHRAVAAGACSYVLKEAGMKEWSTILHQVVVNGSHFSKTIRHSIARAPKAPKRTQADLDALPPRERQFLEHHLAPGDPTYDRIALLMGVTRYTVDGYFRYFNEHWGVHSRAELVRQGMEAKGWVN